FVDAAERHLVGNDLRRVHKAVENETDSFVIKAAHIDVTLWFGREDVQPLAMDFEEIHRCDADADTTIHHDLARKGGAVDRVDHAIAFEQAGNHDIKAFRKGRTKHLARRRILSRNLEGVGGAIFFCKLQVAIIQIGHHQSLGVVQLHNLRKDQTAHTLPCDQDRRSLVDPGNLHRMQYAGKNLDEAGIYHRKSRRHNLHVERPADDVLG